MTIAAVRLSSGFDTAGVLALAMSISNLVFPIAEYRLRTVQVTDVHGEHTSQEYLGMRLIASSAALIIGGVYTLLTTNPNAFLVIMIYTLSQVIATYLEGFHATQQRSMRMDYIGISYLLQGFGGLIAFCVGITLFNSLLAATLFLTAAIIITGVFYDAPRARRFGSIRPVIRWRNAITTFAKLFPLAMVNAALSIVTLVPRQHLSSVMGEDALGIYASVAVPAVIIQASATYIYTPVLGRLIELMMTDKSKAVSLLARITIFFVAVGTASCAIFWMAGEWILGLVFGSEIIPYIYLIQPALLLSLVTAFVWFTNDILLGLRDYIGCLLGGIVAAGVTVITTSPLTHRFGLNSPSIVGIVASTIALLVMGLFLVRDYRRLTPTRSSFPENK
ncbi:polysaccharide biosynthesis protein [Actinomyces sp. ZJ308]|uniref:polysaccharide biosynthesis protein n=1 Tax=Actinomyces sp. ZJ308 TaxID=2708342 RepID=UPI00141E0403|nr:polysaccharide biosynthesis protein [Actinomyces sp. ZJ308]